MKPGETVLKALKRLGGGGAAADKNKFGKSKLVKKNVRKAAMDESGQAASQQAGVADSAALNAVTEAADSLLAAGMYGT